MTPAAAAFLDRLAAWADRRSDLRAILLVGSQARVDDRADAWSDVDLVVLADDAGVLLDSTDWLGEVGRPIATFVESTLLGQRERRVLFDDGLDVDFTVLPTPVGDRFLEDQDEVTGTVLRRGVRVMHDRDGDVTARVESIAASPAPASLAPDQHAFDEVVNDFWYHVLWTARKLRRGELWVALECCNGRLAQLLVQQVRWCAALAHAHPWHGARFLEEWAPPWIRARLPATVAPYDATALPGVLRAAGDLSRDVAREVASGSHLVYPDGVDRAVGELVDEVLRVG